MWLTSFWILTLIVGIESEFFSSKKDLEIAAKELKFFVNDFSKLIEDVDQKLTFMKR
jgi:hypothetical protein